MSSEEAAQASQSVHQPGEAEDEVVTKRGMSEQRSRKKSSMSSWNSEMDHDKEWETRKDLLANLSTKKRVVGRCVSDCTGMRSKRSIQHVRTRSLTDADLDELRGCIDLGFGFRNEADPDLWETLPALELCYAIAQQFKQVHHCSPVSPLFQEDFSECSEDCSSPASWQIASAGDGPQQVKTRLRHWARAVACTVRQNL